MFALLKRILSARALAALIGLLANVVAVSLLPGKEYALASVAIVITAVASPLFYQPFSKYVLISGQWKSVERAFWAVQPTVILLMLVAAGLWWAIARSVTPALAASAVVFALSQGLKEFSGELARTRGRIADMQRLYVLDAITTTIFSLAMLLMFRRAEVFLLCSAVSSIIWSWSLMPHESVFRARTSVAELRSIYRYSYGVVGTSSINAGSIAIARSAVLHASPPGTAGAIQFVLDILQKPMALIGSSVTTAALPEARVRPVDGMLRQLTGIMIAAFTCILALAWLVALLPSRIGHDSEILGIPLLIACSVFIWANRYKSSVMDMPLLASPAFSSRLVLGAAGSLVLMLAMTRIATDNATTLVGAAAALAAGGVISLLAARDCGVVRNANVLLVAIVPAFVISLALAIAMMGSKQGIP